MSKKRNPKAEKLIKEFLDLSLGDYAIEKNLFDQFDLRGKLKSLVTDAYFFGLRTGIHYVVSKEENVKNENKK